MRQIVRNRVEIDAIFTISGGGYALCCIAALHGIGYGFNSDHPTVCPCMKTLDGHYVQFIDNNYQHYDHEKHLDCVAQHKPKYATVLDIESSRMFDRILRYAEDLAQHAVNVIVIPKIDCVHEIPQPYMLGYSVPTSYGGTDLPFTAFGERRVHLLGGAWRQQRDLLLHAGMNVVSLDFNHAHKIAKEGGMYTDCNGYEYRLRDTLPGFNRSPYVTAMALSFAGIRAGLDDATRILSLRFPQHKHS